MLGVAARRREEEGLRPRWGEQDRRQEGKRACQHQHGRERARGSGPDQQRRADPGDEDMQLCEDGKAGRPTADRIGETDRARQRQEGDGPVSAAAVECHPHQRKEEVKLEFWADGPEDRLCACKAEQSQELLAVYAIDEGGIGIVEQEEGQQRYPQIERQYPRRPRDSIVQQHLGVGPLPQIEMAHQEAAEHEEQHYPMIAQAVIDPGRQPDIGEMRQHHDQRRKAAQSVQRWNMPPVHAVSMPFAAVCPRAKQKP